MGTLLACSSPYPTKTGQPSFPGVCASPKLAWVSRFTSRGRRASVLVCVAPAGGWASLNRCCSGKGVSGSPEKAPGPQRSKIADCVYLKPVTISHCLTSSGCVCVWMDVPEYKELDLLSVEEMPVVGFVLSRGASPVSHALGSGQWPGSTFPVLGKGSPWCWTRVQNYWPLCSAESLCRFCDGKDLLGWTPEKAPEGRALHAHPTLAPALQPVWPRTKEVSPDSGARGKGQMVAKQLLGSWTGRQKKEKKKKTKAKQKTKKLS